MIIRKFWQWYERNYKINVGVALGLFLLQILHLVWLFAEIIMTKLTGTPLFAFHDLPKVLIILVDYTEIPALIAASLIYIDELKNKFSWKGMVYLLFLNSQWLHLFWITDEFVVDSFVHGASVALPAWLAWAAILIDYLEVPVIFDMGKKFWSDYFSPPQDSIIASSIGSSGIEA